MVPAGWISEVLPPPPNLEKMKTYISMVSNKTIEDAHERTFNGERVYPSDLDIQYIQPAYIQRIGKISKFVTLKNRKHMSQNIADFELQETSLADGTWGLTEPNKAAYYKNLGKLNKAEHIHFSDQAAQFATMCMERQFYDHLKNSRIESTEKSLKRHDRKTSPGPPFSFSGTHKTKDTLLEDPIFLKMVDEGWEHLLEDDYYFLCGTALKEEVRPEEKLIENKQRIFIPGAADFVTLTNRLCGMFNDKFTACHLKTASAVGINPFEGGWQRVRDRLSKYTKCGEYDFSDYDSSLGVYKMLVVCAFRFKCYAPEEQTWDNWHRLLNCYKNLIWSVCVTVDGTLIIKPGGNPSGGANTVVDNTLINYWSLAYAWYQTVSDEYKNYESFDNLVTPILYGDDNSNCVADEISDQFTPTAYCEAVKELGMTCNPVSDKWLTIDEITFLQADFTTTLDGKTVYHLVPSKMYESIKWSTDWSNPCMDMQRAVGMLRVAWSDPPARAYFRKIIDFLFL
jgi:hypothetical protein